MLWLAMMLGCNPTIMEVSGSIDGNSFTPMTAFYGGPYIAFFSVEIDCKEMYWLDKIYRNGEAPYERDLEALQINFNDSDVVLGTYSTGGEAPIRSSFLDINGDAFEVVTSTDGLLTITEVDGEWASGTFDLSFGDDIMSGDFTIPFCTNLIH
jgi:hypothetical protein